jgi:hypothetical protein
MKRSQVVLRVIIRGLSTHASSASRLYIVGCLSDELERTWKEAVVASSKYSPEYFMEEQENYEIRPHRDSNRASSEYKS